MLVLRIPAPGVGVAAEGGAGPLGGAARREAKAPPLEGGPRPPAGVKGPPEPPPTGVAVFSVAMGARPEPALSEARWLPAGEPWMVPGGGESGGGASAEFALGVLARSGAGPLGLGMEG